MSEKRDRREQVANTGDGFSYEEPLLFERSQPGRQGYSLPSLDVPAVVFPVGAVARKGKLILYAGAGDKYIILLSCSLDGLVDYLWEHCSRSS